MNQYCPAVEKFWVTYSGYFRLANTVAFSMGITDGKFLFCTGVSDRSVDNKISKIGYNNSKVYDFFNNLFPADFGSPYLNIPPITIDDRPCLYKRARYTPEMLPDTIYGASEKYFSTFTTPSDCPLLLLLSPDDPNPPHKKEER